MNVNKIPTIEDVRSAADRIRPFIHRTPVLTSRAINDMFSAELFFKCENLQKVGAFKARGACNAVYMLSATEAQYGVVTHSSGNHAQALAYAARLRAIPCTVIMPWNTPSVKQSAVADYGAEIIRCEPTMESRVTTMNVFIEQSGAHPVPPFDDARVIAGQGTAALEMCEDLPDLDMIMAPVGGGGLLSGTAIVGRALIPTAEIIGAEPAEADDAMRSLIAGVRQPPPITTTIADGLRTALGELPFDILRATDVRIVTASEDSIVEAAYRMMERLKIVIEPSASVTVGAMLDNPKLVIGKRVGIIVCGGNLDVRSTVSFR